LSPGLARADDSRQDAPRGFLDEEWLRPIQIARKFGYATDKPIRKAIKSGELKAARAPCRRKLIVAESDVLRWINRDLAYEPIPVDSPASVTPAATSQGRRPRRSGVPHLACDPRARLQG
jgi:hypothetical protein